MKKKSVLFIDDEIVLTKIAEKIIGGAGHDVSTFTSADNALGAFRLNPQSFDIVFTDFTMPMMSGLQLATKIKAIRENIPIVLVTALDPDQAGLPDFVIDGFLKKPYEINDLVSLIKHPPQSINQL